MTKYYQPSGKFSPASFLLFVVTCLSAIPILCLIYAYAIWYIPFFYINALITIGFGFGVGIVLDLLVLGPGKVRNNTLAILFGFLGGLFAVYCQWAIWLDLVINASESYGTSRIGITVIGITVSNISILQSLYLLLSPNTVLSLMGEVNEYGTWGIRGATVSGVFLSIIWVIEALIVLVISVLAAAGKSKRPFSELSNSWAQEKNLPALSYIENPVAFKAALENGNYSVFQDLKEAASVDSQHSVFTLYYSDVKEYYLSVCNRLPEVDDKGKVSFKEDTFMEYLVLEPSAGAMLIQIQENRPVAAAS